MRARESGEEVENETRARHASDSACDQSLHVTCLVSDLCFASRWRLSSQCALQHHQFHNPQAAANELNGTSLQRQKVKVKMKGTRRGNASCNNNIRSAKCDNRSTRALRTYPYIILKHYRGASPRSARYSIINSQSSGCSNAGENRTEERQSTLHTLYHDRAATKWRG